MPSYPHEARAKGLSNVTIVIEFTVNSQGAVSPTMIVKRSTGFPNWDAAVKTTLARWKFKPSATLKRTGRITFLFVLS